MTSFGTKEIEALALIEPKANDNGHSKIEAQVSRANESVIKVTRNKLAKCLRTGADAYGRFCEQEAAEAKLYAMSDRELRDIGVARSEIDCAIVSAQERQDLKQAGRLRSLLGKFRKMRDDRATYVHLVRMENRQLEDIGLTRNDVNAALLGTKTRFANENLVRASNDNDHRRAS